MKFRNIYIFSSVFIATALFAADETVVTADVVDGIANVVIDDDCNTSKKYDVNVAAKKGALKDMEIDTNCDNGVKNEITVSVGELTDTKVMQLNVETTDDKQIVVTIDNADCTKEYEVTAETPDNQFYDLVVDTRCDD